MHVERLLPIDKEKFLAFCFKHRKEVDESFLYDEHLKSFTPDEENPTFIMKEDGNIIAAASLIIDDYHRRGRCGRFRIFYSEDQKLVSYSKLLSETVNYIKGIDKIFLYVPLTNNELSENMKSLNFAVDRYVYYMVKDITESQTINLPDGYTIREFQFGRDEDIWCYIRNTAFSNLKGNSTPITSDMVRKQMSGSDYLEGGFMLLLHNNNPVGIIRGANDDYEGEPAMNIGPFAILPEYQGKGLGRQLLRTAIDLARIKGFKKGALCVNADNESAKELYLKEGFVQVEGVIAYEYHIIQK